MRELAVFTGRQPFAFRRPPLRCVLLLTLCAVTPLSTQQRSPWTAAFSSSPVERSWDLDEGRAEAASQPAAVFLYSLVVPGSGQVVLGQRRWALYLAAEAVALGFLFNRRSEGRKTRDDYRDLAWSSARTVTPPRVDPGFEYYEKLSKWERSGAFDADPARAGFQPETDSDTYNGSVWALAVNIYLPPSQIPPEEDPRYQGALAYYRERANPAELAWDWEADPGAHELYRGLIERSDEAFRKATLAGAFVLANHVLGATDAFVSARLRSATAGQVSGRLWVGPPARNGRWHMGVALGL